LNDFKKTVSGEKARRGSDENHQDVCVFGTLSGFIQIKRIGFTGKAGLTASMKYGQEKIGSGKTRALFGREGDGKSAGGQEGEPNVF